MTVKYQSVCESGNTDADTVIQLPDRECAEMFCDIWRVSHPGTNAYVREVRHIQHHELGLVRMTVEL